VRAGGGRAGGLAGAQQLAAGALGERLHAERGEHLVRGAQLRPRASPPGLAAQPLAIEQVRAPVRAESRYGSAGPPPHGPNIA